MNSKFATVYSELKKCAYNEVKQHHEVPATPQNVDCLEEYELFGENAGVYEKIPGES